ncbi:hypothetical protein BDN72DRAFT_884390 [Pluteus cervinus]|uniref:Uncharacterized protein n=1 Tax=Pluteus cervinus TaxID=181527 RepID=A0ACD3BEY9_9AGAR|nr:hypothetical protein BDN72DRAFT_884390 [Pluteus cervinus]
MTTNCCWPSIPGIIMNLLLIVLALATFTSAQPAPEDLDPLLKGLAESPLKNGVDLEKRVPLMTDDPTAAPLIDLQVFAPPVVPRNGPSCTVELLKHTFGIGSYNAPAVIPYTPPTDPSCGEVGKWAAVSMNLSVYSIGTQYDRLSAIYLSHTEIWRSSGAEPTKTGTIWNTIKDVTHFTPLFSRPGDLMMDFSNIVASELLLDGVFDVALSATFHAPSKEFPTPETADIIIPLSNGSPDAPNFFSISDDTGAITSITLPPNTSGAYVEVFCSGNSAEEFWYLNTPDEFTSYFPESTGIVGKGPFREVQVLVDDKIAGFVWPYPVIYTGGITPSNWRPLTSYGAYDSPTYWIDITPFIPVLSSPAQNHTITLRVVGQGKSPSFNSNWFVSGSVHVKHGKSATKGTLTKYQVGDLRIQTTGGANSSDGTVWTKVTASRDVLIESELLDEHNQKRLVQFTQKLRYSNDASYANEGWVQVASQITQGTTSALHNGKQVLRDAFEYPISVFSNYSLYTAEFGGYGSAINQTYSRALTPPTGIYKSILSVQHAKGEIGMDNWSGLRHAINGTGSTNQTFAYSNGRGETYFRDIAAKNDGWVHDVVWGSLKNLNPPVPSSQIYGPIGGPGFRRSIAEEGRVG